MLRFLTQFKSKCFLNVLLLLCFPSFIFSHLPYLLAGAEAKTYFHASPSQIIQGLFNEDGLLMFDAVMDLIEAIENDELDDICTDEDWYEINRFIVFLARQGVLPN